MSFIERGYSIYNAQLDQTTHLPQLTAEERMEMERYNPKSPADREEEQEENEFLGGKPMQQKQEGTHHH